MKKQKNSKLNLEDLNVESFITATEKNSQIHTGFPAITEILETKQSYLCTGFGCTKVACQNSVPGTSGPSNVYAPLCNPLQAFKSLVFGGGLPFYC